MPKFVFTGVKKASPPPAGKPPAGKPPAGKPPAGKPPADTASDAPTYVGQAGKGAPPVVDPVVEDSPPEPVSETDDLDAQASELETEVRQLESRLKGRAPVKMRATIEERRADELSKKETQEQLTAKRKELIAVVKALEASKRTPGDTSGIDMGEGPIGPARKRRGDLSGPTYPTRGRTRADEKLREAESRVYTAERMSPGFDEYATMGPRRREAVLELEGGEPRRYAASRKREELKRALGLMGRPSTPIESSVGLDTPLVGYPYRAAETFIDRTVPRAIDVATGGPMRWLAHAADPEIEGAAPPMTSFDPSMYIDPVTGKPAEGIIESQLIQRKPFADAPHQGGRMFAPTAPKGQKVDPTKVRSEIAIRTRQILGAQDQISKLKDSVRRGPGAKYDYAQIAALEDSIEQLRAEELQLRRVMSVTYPEESDWMYAGSGILPKE